MRYIIYKHIAFLLGLCFVPSIGFSQLVERDSHISCYFTYPQSSSTIIPSLGNNPYELSRLNDFIDDILHADSLTISRIRLTGYCSIEGEYSFNSRLARERVEGFHQYLQATYPVLYRYPVDLAWVAEDWQTLVNQVKNSSAPNREEVLSILRKVSDTELRKKKLRRLDNGHSYQYMFDNFFPLLRRVEITVEYDHHTANVNSNSNQQRSTTPDPLIYNVLEQKKEKKTSEKARVVRVDRHTEGETVVTFTASSLKEEQGRVEVKTGRSSTTSPFGYSSSKRRRVHAALNCRWAIKTNLLYWAGITADAERTTPVPNLSVEYFLSPRWSIEGGAKYSNWHYDNHRQFQGISGYRLEARYYLLLSTMHNQYITPYLGAYGRFGDFNIQSSCAASPPLEGAGGGDGHTGRYRDAGLSAGLHIRLYRGLGLELGARAGYVSSTPTVYNLHNDHNCYQYETSYGKFRVTDLNIDLVYRFRK